MRTLFGFVRRLVSSAVLLAMLLCVAEVGLRISRQKERATAGRGNHVPSRLTMYELPALSIIRSGHPTQPVEVRINSLGFRGPEIGTKAEGVLRIVCLGDETTLALHLPEEEVYTAQLASRLAQRTGLPIEVLNAGVPQGCPLTALVKLRQHLDRLKPDVVLLHVDVSDALDDQRCRPHVRMNESGQPIAVMHPSCRSQSTWKEWEEEFAILAWLRGRLTKELVTDARPSKAAAFQESLAAWGSEFRDGESIRPSSSLAPLTELRDLARSVGAEFVVSTSPSSWQCARLVELPSDRSSDHEEQAALVRRPAMAVHRAATESSIPYVDVTPVFLQSASPAELYDRPTGQLSAAGHALYADLLAEFLTGGGQ